HLLLGPRLPRHRHLLLRDGHRRQRQAARPAADAALGSARARTGACAGIPHHLAPVRQQHRGLRPDALWALYAGGAAGSDLRAFHGVLHELACTMATALLEESHIMPKVIALYRYPIKGFTPEVCQQLTILPGGRVAGDRVLNFRFADAPVADAAWCRKSHGVVLANTPGLARLHVRYDAHTRRLPMEVGAQLLVDAALDAPGRARLVTALTYYVQSLVENPLKDHPERLPVKLVGDGMTPCYQDNVAGQTTLHSHESLVSAGVALGDAALDERRFRHNIVI